MHETEKIVRESVIMTFCGISHLVFFLRSPNVVVFSPIIEFLYYLLLCVNNC